MASEHYQKLGKKYGKGIYELFSYFYAVRIFTYEGNGEFSYQRKIIGYLNSNKEMIDIRTGEKFQASDLSEKIVPEINSLCYRVSDLSFIDEQLFETEAEKDEVGKSTLVYDINSFEDIIRCMKNFVITTDGFTKLENFEPIRLTKKEIDERKKRQLLNTHRDVFNQIRCVKLCGVISVEGKNRKSKIRWYKGESHVPVYFDSNTGIAVDLRDGITRYELLEMVPKKEGLFAKFGKQTSLELSDAQYDRIVDRMLNQEREHKYIKDMDSITWFNPIYFNYEQMKELLQHYHNVIYMNKLKKQKCPIHEYKK